MTPTSKSSRLRHRKKTKFNAPLTPLTARNIRLLEIYASLPPSAVVPKAVAAAVKGVSEKTITRNYTLVPVSDGRVGVVKSVLESGRTPEAA